MYTRRQFLASSLKAGIALTVGAQVAHPLEVVAQVSMPGQFDRGTLSGGGHSAGVWSGRSSKSKSASKSSQEIQLQKYLDKKVFTSGKNGKNRSPETKLSYWRLGQYKNEALKIARSRAIGIIGHETGPKLWEESRRAYHERYTFKILISGSKRRVELYFHDDRVFEIKLWYLGNTGESVLKYLDREYGKNGQTHFRNDQKNWFCTQKFGSSNQYIDARFNLLKSDNSIDMFLVFLEDKEISDKLWDIYWSKEESLKPHKYVVDFSKPLKKSPLTPIIDGKPPGIVLAGPKYVEAWMVRGNPTALEKRLTSLDPKEPATYLLASFLYENPWMYAIQRGLSKDSSYTWFAVVIGLCVNNLSVNVTGRYIPQKIDYKLHLDSAFRAISLLIEKPINSVNQLKNIDLRILSENEVKLVSWISVWLTNALDISSAGTVADEVYNTLEKRTMKQYTRVRGGKGKAYYFQATGTKI